MENILNKIKAACAENGITLKHLIIEKLELGESGFYYSIKNKSLRVDTLLQIAKILNKPVSYFLDEEGENQSVSINKVDYDELNREVILLRYLIFTALCNGTEKWRFINVIPRGLEFEFEEEIVEEVFDDIKELTFKWTVINEKLKKVKDPIKHYEIIIKNLPSDQIASFKKSYPSIIIYPLLTKLIERKRKEKGK